MTACSLTDISLKIQQWLGELVVQFSRWRQGSLASRSSPVAPGASLGSPINLSFQAMIDDLELGVLVQGAGAEILASNQQALTLLGLTEAQLLGKTSFDPDWHVIHEDGSPFPGPDHPVPQAIATRQPIRHVVMGVYRPRHQDRIWLLVNAEPRLTEQGEIQHVICTFQDISERKRAEDRLQDQLAAEKMLGAIMQKIRQSLDLKDILHTTVTEIRTILHADRVVIGQRQAEDHLIIIEESVVDPLFSIAGQSIADACLSSVWPAEGRDPSISRPTVHAIEDRASATLDPCYAHLLNQFQITASLVTPLFQGDYLWGLVMIHQCQNQRIWQAWEKELLQKLANRLAIAIQQSELYQQVQSLNLSLELQIQDRTEQLEKSLDFEALLRRITDKVRDSLDEQQILQSAVQELGSELGVMCCDTGIFNPQEMSSTIYCEYLPSLPQVEKVMPAQGKKISIKPYVEPYRTLLAGKSIQWCFVVNLDTAIRGDESQYAILACPLRDDQEMLGDMWLFRANHDYFNWQEVRLVEQVANQCAIAIRQSRLYQAVQAQVRELEALNELKDDFVSTVSHELRTPLTSMRMALRLLEMTSDPEKKQTYYQLAISECERQITLINDLLDLQKEEFSQQELYAEPIYLEAWISELIQSVNLQAEQKQQQILLACLNVTEPFWSDLSYLNRIGRELIGNAIKYTSDGGLIRLELSSLSSGIQLIVSNSSEISHEELPKLFNKFYRIRQVDRWKHGGTGLGLALVKQLVNQLKGDIVVSSQAGWTHFRVWIPDASSRSETNIEI
ncbi:MAG: GAF domain-containing protein [Cyanobacteriota bacterium]|nr:GAF domain-containing protein [Cyanobacteriota bacterium]